MDKYVTRSSKRVKVDAGSTGAEERQLYEWKCEPKRETLWYLTPLEQRDSDKVASFDMDGTIITTKSGRVFPKDIYDWKFFHATVPRKLRELYESGYKVVFITNQAGVSSGQTSLPGIKQKINDIISNLSFVPYVFMSTAKDQYRKPSSAIWRFMNQSCNGSISVDKEKSFFVGDFAGRLQSGTKKKDKGCSDRKFAANVGVKFYTPESYFLGEEERKWSWMGIDPRTIPEAKEECSWAVEHQELVLFVGMPASGKSSFFKMFFEPFGYVHVNQDTLKTKPKCVSAARKALSEGSSVVVDNTNPDAGSRNLFISTAHEANVPVRCFWFQTTLECAKHLNMVREKLGQKDHVPDVAYNSYNKRFVEPGRDEGISDVLKVNFEARFPSKKFKTIFLEYT